MMNELYKPSRFASLFKNIILLLSTVILFAVALNNDYHLSPLLVLSPMAYLLLTMFVLKANKAILQSITAIIIFSGYFIRMNISPLLLVLTNYQIEIITKEWIQYLDYSVLLATFEYIVLCIYLLSSKNVRQVTRTEYQAYSVQSLRLNFLTKFFLILMVSFVLYCILSNPGFLLAIDNVFNVIRVSEQDNIARNVLYNQMRDNSSSRLFTLFYTAITFVQVIAPAALLNMVYNNRIKIFSSRQKKGSVFLSLVVMAVSLSILTDDLSKAVIVAFAIFITLAQVYPDALRKWIPIFGISGLVLGVLLLLAKSGLFNGKINGLNSLGRIFNTYFSGIPNIAVGLTVEYENKFNTALGDFTRSIPIFAHFFMDLPRSQDLFNLTYHGISGYTNEIMPTICYGYKYLGPFAPALTLIIYNMCFKIESKFKNAKTIFDKSIYAYLLVYFAICPIMYMFTSFLTMFWYSIIFSFIIKSNAKRISYEANTEWS